LEGGVFRYSAGTDIISPNTDFTSYLAQPAGTDIISPNTDFTSYLAQPAGTDIISPEIFRNRFIGSFPAILMEFPKPREIYDPSEDSALLLSEILSGKYSGEMACDMGTGSGIAAKALAKFFGRVVAVDINPGARESFSGKDAEKISFVESNLFGSVPKAKFDLIVFNSPYLPGFEDRRWSCGDGEILVEFLSDAVGFLSERGEILFLISSLTPERVLSEARRIYSVSIASEMRLPGFETLFLLRLVPIR